MIFQTNGGVQSFFNQNRNQARPTGYQLQVFCDGVASKWTPALANNEIWIDASQFFRQGINLGPSFQYAGASTAHLYGSMVDRSVVRQVQNPDTGAAIATAIAPSFADIGDLSPATAATTLDLAIYNVFKITFAGAGVVNIISM